MGITDAMTGKLYYYVDPWNTDKPPYKASHVYMTYDGIVRVFREIRKNNPKCLCFSDDECFYSFYAINWVSEYEKA